MYGYLEENLTVEEMVSMSKNGYSFEVNDGKLISIEKEGEVIDIYNR